MTRRLADRYLLGEEIGAGGSSRIHTALDERLGRRVAVKLLDALAASSADPAGRDRFLREGRTAASFVHPNAVTVFDAGEDGNDLYIVMELVDGSSLAEHLAQTGPLPVHEAIRIATAALGALDAAHAAGVIHRDVKPANIMLGTGGDVKLTDFGIAKRFDELDAAITASHLVMGTPRYLAPEQARGDDATPATDVHGTGLVLFEMLTGRLPFDGDPAVETASAVRSGPVPSVVGERSEVPEPLAAVVTRALARDPADRYPTAREMSAALAAVPAAPATAGATGIRSGDTEVLPLAPDARTAALPPAPDDATEVLTHSPRPAGAERSADRRSARRTTVTMLAVLGLLVGAVAVAVATGDGESPVDGSDAPTATGPSGDEPVDDDAEPAAEPDVVPADPPEPVDDPEPTASPVTDAPAPTVPTPTTPTPTDGAEGDEEPVEEIIPGFPATDDLEVFLAQLADDPDLVGESGEELLDDLEKVLDEGGRKQREEASELREELVEWVEDDEIHPAIAAALDELLAPLTRPGRS